MVKSKRLFSWLAGSMLDHRAPPSPPKADLSLSTPYMQYIGNEAAHPSSSFARKRAIMMSIRQASGHWLCMCKPCNASAALSFLFPSFSGRTQPFSKTNVEVRYFYRLGLLPLVSTKRKDQSRLYFPKKRNRRQSLSSE